MRKLALTIFSIKLYANHLPQRLPLDVVQKIRERTGRRYIPWTHQMTDPSSIETSSQPESFRIFNRSDYGYYRSDLQNIRTLISSEDGASIDLDQVYNKEINEEKIKCTRKAFNVEYAICSFVFWIWF